MAIRSRPLNVVADRARRVLTITWGDGRDAYYSFAGLRAVCPCVLCQGGHANMGKPADKLLLRRAQNEDLNLEAVTPVGSYAVQFRWNDGHDSGIYTWDYLYEAGLD
ncbi:MAG: DUF971 domain-containing protein [Candidatus Promineofilum sp.]|nr:DUF971 domain-containing protein [Promineifilum sp.]